MDRHLQLFLSRFNLLFTLPSLSLITAQINSPPLSESLASLQSPFRMLYTFLCVSSNSLSSCSSSIHLSPFFRSENQSCFHRTMCTLYSEYLIIYKLDSAGLLRVLPSRRAGPTSAGAARAAERPAGAHVPIHAPAAQRQDVHLCEWDDIIFT
jgi:hypothetical protein